MLRYLLVAADLSVLFFGAGGACGGGERRAAGSYISDPLTAVRR